MKSLLPSSSAMSPSFSVPIAFAPSATLSPTLVNQESLDNAPSKRLPKFRTTVRSFPVLLSTYTDNSALLTVCQSLNKLSVIIQEAVHPSSLTFTSFSSYEIFPRSKRVFKTNSSGFMERSTCVKRARLLAGRECDRLVLLFPLHHKTKPFLPRSPLIVAVMFSSLPGVRLFPSLQRITTIFFSVNEKTHWKLDSTGRTLNKTIFYPGMFL